MNMFRLLPVLLLMPLASHAQSASLGNTKKVQTQQGGAPPPSSTFKKDPVSRLDAGAVLCPTEVALQQHQAAVVAMLNGQDTSGGRGCRTIRVMTPVTIVTRHGRTMRIAG